MGKLVYITENLININTLNSVSSQDDSGFYNKENVYNESPSYPIRFETKGAIGSPEWICVSFLVGTRVTFAGIFGHSLTDLSAAGDELRLKACNLGCQGSGSCDWNDPLRNINLKPRLLANSENLYQRGALRLNHLNYRFEFIDQNNEFAIDIGEVVLGVWQEFGTRCYLQPGRPDGPRFFMGRETTHYGQVHINYYSTGEKLELTFKNINDEREVDEIQVFLKQVQENGGRFIIIPDTDLRKVYYVYIDNLDGYANRLSYGAIGKEGLREWKINLFTLTVGRRLL